MTVKCVLNLSKVLKNPMKFLRFFCINMKNSQFALTENC